MAREKIDVVKLFVKIDLNIPLTPQEEVCMNELEDEEKQMMFDLISASSYIDEVIRVIDQMIQEYSNHSDIQQEVIEKCNNKKLELLHKEKQKNLETSKDKKR